MPRIFDEDEPELWDAGCGCSATAPCAYAYDQMCCGDIMREGLLSDIPCVAKHCDPGCCDEGIMENIKLLDERLAHVCTATAKALKSQRLVKYMHYNPHGFA